MNNQLLMLIKYRNILDQLFVTVLQNVDLSLEQYLLMEKMDREKEETPGTLAACMGVSRPAISRQCQSLGEKGLIERANVGSFIGDSRKVYYRLTTKGKQLLLKIRLNSNDMIDSLDSGFVTTNWDEIDNQTALMSDAVKRTFNINEIQIF